MLFRIFYVLISLPLIVFAKEDLTTKDIVILKDPSQIQEINTTHAKEIYTDNDIEKSGSLNLFDYLSQHTSLNILPNYGDKSKPLIDIRGYGIESGYQNIVINLDGQRLNNIDLNSQLIGIIPLNSIKKIEILKGSGSVRYGDGAMAGVINIFTKNYTKSQIRTSFGSAGQEIHDISLGYSYEDWINLSIDIHDEELDGYSDADTKGNKDKVSNTSQSLRLNLMPIKDLKINFGINSARNNAYLVGGLTKDEFLSNPKQNSGNQYSNYDYDVDKYSIGLTYQINKSLQLNLNHFNEDKSQHAITSYNDDTYDYDYEGYLLVIPYKTNELYLNSGIQIFNGDRKDSLGTASRDSEAAFIEAEYEPSIFNEKLIISGGIRYEDIDYAWNSASASLTTNEKLKAWDFGLNYKILKNFNIFSNYNHSFQAPDIDRSFVAEYNGPGFTYSGRAFNTFINPSDADTLNIGINHVADDNQLRLTVFYSKIKDEIVYNPNTYRNENIDNSKKYGLEIFNTYNLSEKTNINISYNFVQAKIGSNSQGFTKGKNMPGVPEHSVIVNVNQKFFSNGNINLNHVWKDETYIFSDFNNNASQKQPAFISTNLSIDYNINSITKIENLSFFVGINNLFEHKNAVQGYVNSIYPFNFSRTWFTGIEAKF